MGKSCVHGLLSAHTSLTGFWSTATAAAATAAAAAA